MAVVKVAVSESMEEHKFIVWIFIFMAWKQIVVFFTSIIISYIWKTENSCIELEKSAFAYIAKVQIM